MASRATYTIKIDGEWHPVSGFAEASRLVRTMRDASGQGSSDWYSYPGQGTMLNESRQLFARVSYNGRVWEPKADEPVCLMEAQ